jgi:hypothetical protein
VTTFAWLAGEPGEERMRRWLKSDCEARLRADEDCRRVGVKILDDDRRKEFEETAAAQPEGMPALLDRAEAADAHWVSRVTGLRDSTTPTSRSLRSRLPTVQRDCSSEPTSGSTL